MADDLTVVHVTHETIGKIGGIGAVLAGLFGCKSYLDEVGRSIIIGPLFNPEGSVSSRLGEDGQVLYSSADGLVATQYGNRFGKIEKDYNTAIVYGRRTFRDRQTGIESSPEVLLIDVRHMDKGQVDEFKRRMYEEFGVRSDLYEHIWEYEQYVRLAPPAIAALKALGVNRNETVVLSHEFMGMPTALAANLEREWDFKTIFYAHEVATMRRIVEEHPGHDTMFYNVMERASGAGVYVTDVFGEQGVYFKHPLVKASKYCDRILAVGDYTAKELLFLGPEFKAANIDVVYNGIPAQKISVAEKLQSKEKLRRYCENLLGYKPDFVFTHVTRLVTSKGLWRDLHVLRTIEKQFRALNKTAVLFLLSTQVCQRPSSDIYKMESAYGWPVAHREGWPDLCGDEADFYTTVQRFNARSRNIKIVFLNQFGFSPGCSGRKMPADMEFMDIRRGSDVEFGQSIYEPFGIAQLEPLTYGSICVISGICGCAGFVRAVMQGKNIKNVLIVDYTDLGEYEAADIDKLLQIDQITYDKIEEMVSRKVAADIIRCLPRDESEIEGMIQSGYSLAKNMSWETVVKNYLLRSLQMTVQQEHQQEIVSRA